MALHLNLFLYLLLSILASPAVTMRIHPSSALKAIDLAILSGSQFTANAIGRPVKAGPDEATSTGNLICQLVALGEVADLNQARAVVRESFPTKDYLPEDKERWEEAYARFLKVVGN